MKNSFLKFCLLSCIFLFCLAYSSQEKTSDNTCIIEGEISDIEEGTKIWLFRHSEGVSTGNTLGIKNGRFIVSVENVYQPEKMTISGSLFSNSLSLDIWIAPGEKIIITGKGSLPPLWEVESAISYQKEANLYTNNCRIIITELALISSERDKLKTLSSFSWDVIASHNKIDSLYKARNAYSLRSKQIFADLDVMHKTDVSPVWLDKLRNITNSLKNPDFNTKHTGKIRKKAKQLYNRIPEKEKNTSLGYEIAVNLFP